MCCVCVCVKGEIGRGRGLYHGKPFITAEIWCISINVDSSGSPYVDSGGSFLPPQLGSETTYTLPYDQAAALLL